MTAEDRTAATKHRDRRCSAAILALAGWIDRGLTWGSDPTERAEILRERHADRCDHLADPDATLTSVALRVVTSAFADLTHRILGDHTSAVPAGILSGLLGVGAAWLSIASHFPAVNRLSDAVVAVGFVGVAIVLLHRPRELDRIRLVPILIVVSVGTAGAAATLPVTTGVGIFDIATKVALATIAFGSVIIATALAQSPVNRRWLIRGGALLWIASLVLATGEIGWLVVRGIDHSSAASLLIASGCILIAAVFGRLRHVAIAER